MCSYINTLVISNKIETLQVHFEKHVAKKGGALVKILAPYQFLNWSYGSLCLLTFSI